MSAPVIQSADCCNPCDSIPITQVVGPAGAAGAAGSNGTNGADGFSTTSAGFTQPAVGATVVLTVVSSAWAIVGADAYVQNGGYYLVTAITDSTHVTLQNRGYTGNAAPTAIIGSGQRISLAGIKGTDGVAVGVTLNSISPSTTRGDLLADNGANAPAASLVRQAAGTDGQILTSEASQATGLLWQTLLPLASGTTDNVVPRFNTPLGTEEPSPVQVSLMLISDTGALQSTPSGGNARGASAIDLQPVRGAATQVASGANSTIAGGLNNTASGARSSVGGGTTNVASGADSVVNGGTGNTASGVNSVIGGGGSNVASNTGTIVGAGGSNQATGSSSAVLGGGSNVASALYSGILGGLSNQASGQNSIICGGDSGAASDQFAFISNGSAVIADKYGQHAHNNGGFASGLCQTSELMWRATTTNATPSELFLDGSSATKRATVPTDTTWAFEIIGVARRSTGVSVCFKIDGGIKNDAGAVVLVAAVTTIVTADGSAGALVAASFVASADDPNNALILTVTGVAAQVWRWVARARLIEVGH